MKRLTIALMLAFWAMSSVAAAQAGLGAKARMVTKLDSIARAMAGADPAPGISVAIVHKGDTLLMRGYGEADVENNVPAAANTVYRIGSITKQFTAAAIMKLVEEGRLDLDDPITKHIDGYPKAAEKVTIHHLLNHTSGIPSYTGMGDKFWGKSRLDLSHEEMFELFKHEPFEFEPGERYAYNNSAYYLLGVIIERTTGKSYGAWLDEAFFEPLKLSATTYCGNRKLIAYRAAGYDIDEGTLVNANPLSMNTPFSAGALCSTIEDLVIWTAALAGGRVVSPGSYTKMTTATTLNGGKTQNYGYGLGVGSLGDIKKISHGGGINGFSTFLAYYPEHELTICVLTNGGQGGAAKIEKKLAHVVLGVQEPTFEEIEMSAETLAQYPGVYEISPAFKITISLEGNQLKAEATGQSIINIFPYGTDKFFLKVVEAQISFRRDASGSIIGLTLHQSGQNVEGKLVK